jgi:hypothetical protein
MKNKTNSKKRLSLCSILTIVFVALKLAGAIDWKWVWVLCPFWIGILIGIIILAVTFIYVLIAKK